VSGHPVGGQPAVVGHPVGAGLDGQRVAALAHDGDPVQPADHVAEQLADVEFGTRRGQGELVRLDGRDDGFGLGHGPLVELAWVCDLCHEPTLAVKHDR
jgi:hypothetical protein